jgi:hypothetical protein
MMTSETNFEMTATPSSNSLGVIILPNSAHKAHVSGMSGYSTWTTVVDALHARHINGDYSTIRVVGMCVKIINRSPSTATVGSLRVWCGPSLLVGSRTGPMVGLENKRYQEYDPRLGCNFAWCPNTDGDFVPFNPLSVESNGDVEGKLMSDRSAIHMEFSNMVGAPTLSFNVTTIYECFVAETAREIGGEPSPQNHGVVDRLMNALSGVTFETVGDSIPKVLSYASNLATMVGRPDISALLETGSSTGSKLLLKM